MKLQKAIRIVFKKCKLTSTVGLPLESKISRANTPEIEASSSVLVLELTPTDLSAGAVKAEHPV
jgi:hypothetical protein